ncbi:MAG: hypothetical protein EKK41_02750 [Hyphomicrobiales bacterium]|nr:MAG: hypothetical protein EKK41_02750 [Hyphomicrobiales bacterium]
MRFVDGLGESQYWEPSSGNGVAAMVIAMTDRTNEEQDLALVEELVAGPAGILLERIEATPEGPRPDFRIQSWRGFAGFCEVKSPRDDWIDEQLKQAPPMTVVGGARSDPTFNRIARNIEKAVRQFDAVNSHHRVPNVLVIVNHDCNSGFADLCETLTGHFRADSGETYPTNMRIATRLGSKRKRVDLYCWIDDYRGRREVGGWLMTDAVPEHTSALRTLLVNVLPKKASAA